MYKKRTSLFLATTACLIAGWANAEQLDRAIAAIDAHATVMRHAPSLQVAAGEDLQAKDVIVDTDGTRHVRVERMYGGLPVIGGDMVIHTHGDELVGVTRSFARMAKPDVSPRVSSWTAEQAAIAHFDGTIESVSTRGLVIYAHDSAPRLAYELRVRGVLHESGRANMRYFVDAMDGKVISRWNLFQTIAATGKAHTLLAGTVNVTSTSTGDAFELIDPTRGGNAVHDAKGLPDTPTNLASALPAVSVNNEWGNGSTADSNTVAGDVAYGVSATWDYFKQVHGRNGIWGDGRGTRSYVHTLINVGGGNYTAANAAWNGESMEYGDGGESFLPLVSVDITGHEMTHGVIGATAGLAYVGESGGLNEATADIFGSMVERRAIAGKGRANYLIGEQVDLNGGGLTRYMFKPSLDGSSPDCWSREVQSMEVHSASGIGNHFFYLLAEGASVPNDFGLGTRGNLRSEDLVCNGDTSIEGVGADAAERIWYRALVLYMTTSTNYARAREATIQAATDMHGATSKQVDMVKRAWDAVDVR